jgi:glycyl-tRNA synthetase beta chain
MSRPLLLEIGTEDLPARYVAPLSAALSDGIAGGLSRRGVAHGDVESFATPRRIAVLIRDVAEQQPDQLQERSGPALAAAYRNGEPTPAGLGFARSCGVEMSALGEKDGKLHFVRSVPGQATADLLPAIFEDTLKQMDELVPKRMRWGSGSETFVRPVQWLLCLLGGDVIALSRFGLEAERITYGHRFHAPDAIALSEPDDYANALRRAHVWADFASRRAEIRRQIESKSALLGGHARITDDLLDEVTALVEWPVVIAGDMEARFMKLPPEVIVSTVETNQRYFTLFADAKQTELLPYFITIANIDSTDVGQVIAGNERVVRPRLTDALFFWEQDLKLKLDGYRAKLSDVTFVKGLGSIADKAARIETLAAKISEGCGGLALVETQRAAQLCKTDLVTKMVYEFPELQGIMGGYYATQGGESSAVAAAIREHYLPTQQGTPIPSSPAGRFVALADKLDTLAGIFALGQKPTASKDPFALRRAALGALRILVEGELDLDLRDLLGAALEGVYASAPTLKRDATSADELFAFCLERLRGYCLDRGASSEAFEAVRASGVSQPLDFDRRLQALMQFLPTAEAASLAGADKRARNILRQAGELAVAINPERFEVPAERQLLDALDAVESQLAPLRNRRDYGAILSRLATLKPAVDAFFEAVMVMAEDADVRRNRLSLLVKLDALCREVADLSLLPG